MKPRVTYPDVERATVDLLADLVVAREPDVSVGVGIPTDWTVEHDPHLQVSCDGTPTLDHPIVAHSTVRIVAWAATTSRAKELANLAHGLIVAHDGAPPVAGVSTLTGLLPARDPETRAELASFTVRISIRSTPIPD